MKRPIRTALTALLLPLLVATPALADPDKDELGKGRGRGREDHKDRGEARGNDRGGSQRYSRLDIPSGHLPPPGECRIWYPNRPAGHQPPPGDCRALRRELSPGAWLIRGNEDRRVTDILVVEPDRPGVIFSGRFEVNTGALIREILNF